MTFFSRQPIIPLPVSPDLVYLPSLQIARRFITYSFLLLLLLLLLPLLLRVSCVYAKAQRLGSNYILDTVLEKNFVDGPK
jgi:cytochrome c biogenesis factor